MTVAKWPGTLWQAEIIDEAKNTGLLDYAKYSRANAVKILEKLSLDVLFGNYGEGILKIIESTNAFDIDTVQKLSSTLPAEASALYSKGWNIFGGTVKDQPPYNGRNQTDTIAMPGDEGSSPINNGFSIIYSQVFDRTKDLTGGKAILVDEEGKAYLDGTWSNACNAYLYAAMAIAYQDKLTNNEIEILSKAWEGVYGASTVIS